jgi:internalin A
MDAVEHNWNRIEAWLSSNLPEVITDLNPPASDEAMTRTETVLGLTLPEDLKALYRLHDGQRQQAFGAFFGLWFLSLERLTARWQEWQQIIVHDPALALSADLPLTSTPEGAIQRAHADSAWIPFSEDGLSGHFAIDFHPGLHGQSGQVITFGRYVQNKVVVATDLSSLLAWVADELERGKGRVSEAAGMRIFAHMDLADGNFEDGLRRLLYNA